MMSNSMKSSEIADKGNRMSDYQLIAEFSKVTDHDSRSANDTTQCDDNQQPNLPDLLKSIRERKKPSFYGQECSNIIIM